MWTGRSIIFMEKQGKQEQGIIMDYYDKYMDKLVWCIMSMLFFYMFHYIHRGLLENPSASLIYWVAISDQFRLLSILTVFLYICRYVSIGVAGVGGRIRWLTATGHMCWWQGLCLCIACVYFISWIWSCCIDMRVMGYTMYVSELMYLRVLGWVYVCMMMGWSPMLYDP